MTTLSPAGVLRRRRVVPLVLVLAVWLVPAEPAAAQTAPPAFSGVYAGVEVGRVNVIGGALVAGVDTLAQDSRPALTFLGGGRYEFPNRLDVGVELGYGLEDGNLRLDDPSQALSVDYRNRNHFRFGGTLGVVLGAARKTLLFGYASENTRTFDVTVSQAGQTFEQSDEQGLLRYGIGVERRIARPLGLRATVGASRADFGDRVTNMAVKRPVEAAVGLLFLF